MGRLIAHTGWTMDQLDQLQTEFPKVFAAMEREVLMIRARQMVMSSKELA